MMLKIVKLIGNVVGLTIETALDVARYYFNLVLRVSFLALGAWILGGLLIYLGASEKNGFLNFIGILIAGWTTAGWVVLTFFIRALIRKAAVSFPIVHQELASAINIFFGSLFFGGYLWITHAVEFPFVFGLILFSLGLLIISELLIIQTGVTSIMSQRLQYILRFFSCLLIPLNMIPPVVLNRTTHGHLVEILTGTRPDPIDSYFEKNLAGKEELKIKNRRTGETLEFFEIDGTPKVCFERYTDGSYDLFRFFEGQHSPKTGHLCMPLTDKEKEKYEIFAREEYRKQLAEIKKEAAVPKSEVRPTTLVPTPSAPVATGPYVPAPSLEPKVEAVQEIPRYMNPTGDVSFDAIIVENDSVFPRVSDDVVLARPLGEITSQSITFDPAQTIVSLTILSVEKYPNKDLTFQMIPKKIYTRDYGFPTTHSYDLKYSMSVRLLSAEDHTTRDAIIGGVVGVAAGAAIHGKSGAAIGGVAGSAVGTSIGKSYTVTSHGQKIRIPVGMVIHLLIMVKNPNY